MAETAGERTEKATPRRREKAREKGQVAKSQEVNSFFVLTVGMAVLLAMSGHFAGAMARNTAYLLGQAHFLAPDGLVGVRYLLSGNVQSFFWTLAPLAGLVLIAAVGANLLQVGLKLRPRPWPFSGAA